MILFRRNMTYYDLHASQSGLPTAFAKNISHIYCKEDERSGHNMNETLQDLEQKREVVEKDIDFLFETLQKEITAQKKI